MLCDVVRGCYSCSQLSWLRRHTKCWQTGHINSSHPVHSKAHKHPKLRWSALQTSATSLEVNVRPTSSYQNWQRHDMKISILRHTHAHTQTLEQSWAHCFTGSAVSQRITNIWRGWMMNASVDLPLTNISRQTLASSCLWRKSFTRWACTAACAPCMRSPSW